jgi:hypothetical protein
MRFAIRPAPAIVILTLVLAGAAGRAGIALAGDPPGPDCPPGALLEGEPDCHDGYYDSFNGGCYRGVGWEEIYPPGQDTAVMCGKSGTYLRDDLPYRDTDWFVTYAGEAGSVRLTLQATFEVVLALIYGTDCATPLYEYVTGVPFESIQLTYPVEPWQEFWVFVGPNTFVDVPCGSDYVLGLEGIWDPIEATEKTTWGAVKQVFR